MSELFILMERSDAFERGWRFGSFKPQPTPRGNGRRARTTWALGALLALVSLNFYLIDFTF